MHVQITLYTYRHDRARFTSITCELNPISKPFPHISRNIGKRKEKDKISEAQLLGFFHSFKRMTIISRPIRRLVFSSFGKKHRSRGRTIIRELYTKRINIAPAAIRRCEGSVWSRASVSFSAQGNIIMRALLSSNWRAMHAVYEAGFHIFRSTIGFLRAVNERSLRLGLWEVAGLIVAAIIRFFYC